MQRTITSPGVSVQEMDISLVAPNNAGTTVFITGFTQQGPVDEVIKISSKEDLALIYGTPTNSAERYFYHTANELLNSPANIYASRLAYGDGSGVGFGSKYSALAYPVTAVNAAGTACLGTLNESPSATYILGEPVHYELNDTEYQSLANGIQWSATGSTTATLNSVAALANAGVIVVNKAQTTVNDQFEGYYVGIGDNVNVNPGSDYKKIVGVKAVNANAATTSAYLSIPEGTLQFNLTSNYINGPQNSVSQIMEKLTPYDINNTQSNDLVGVGVFKLRKSIFATEAFKLDYVLEDSIVGSIDYHRTQLSPTGGPNLPYFIETQDTKSRNVEIFINDNLSNRLSATSLDVNGIPQKKVRVLTQDLINASSAVALSSQVGVATSILGSISGALGVADKLYALGAYSNSTIATKSLGDIPTKLQRALEGIRNEDIYDIDIVVEAGLGTIYAAASASATSYYDEFSWTSTLSAQVEALRTSNAVTTTTLRDNYSTIFNTFEAFCSPPYDGGGRGDCIFVADPIRHIFVTGVNNKVLTDKSRNFQKDIYWPMRHQFENENTSYAATYANWAQVYDAFIGQQVWVPFSGFAAAAMVRTDAARFPWIAPAGFTNGLVKFATNIAVNPNQKQRDELYKSNLNPVSFFPSQGMVIYGQKTLSKKPSAFDRINVRRLFLALERPTRKLAQYFVFEPNTTFTRTRLLNTLTPLFERAKNTEGLYEYLLVCDERNNTAQVIDNNELVMDIYIKPVRAAEFILVNFYATRSDTNFRELVGA